MGDLAVSKAFHAVAFYLPQYHPIPENDRWWGDGFTEWTNVRKGRPLFEGHYQPHDPGELGYYDLRDPEVRSAQADLARSHGIEAFCYYHYWFNGRQLLERPFNEVLASKSPDFPFCLCWANESWTRVWDGGSRQVLLEQQYSAEDDLHHIRWLLQAFADPRYLRVNGKPLFLVYRASQLPDPLRTTQSWREEAVRAGLGQLYLLRVESFPTEHTDPAALGFDGAVEFQPDSKNLPILRKILRRLSLEVGFKYVDTYDYQAFSERMSRKPDPGYRRYPCVTPMWDNSARRRMQPTILHASSPARYRQWLERALQQAACFPASERLVFLNAWNEWSEGCHLEPCARWGDAYLKATRDALGAAELTT